MKRLCVALCALFIFTALAGCGTTESVALTSAELQKDVLTSSIVFEESESMLGTSSLRDRYPYVSGYSIADADPNMTWKDLTADTVLVKFKVIERLEDENRVTDMMGGVLGMTEEDLAFFEEAGMRYLPTTLEHYLVEVEDSVAMETSTIDICHNTMFGEMNNLLAPGKEFATFLTQDQDDLICNYEALYYVTEADTLLSVIDNPISSVIDGISWGDLIDSESRE